MKQILAVFVGLLSAGVFAQSNVYQFVVEGYPITREGCEAAEHRFSEDFTSETGLSVFSTQCRTGSYSIGGFDIVVNYISRVEFTERVRVFDPERQSYPTRQECLDDLSFQTDLFEEQTGLEAFYNYCTERGRVFIEGFGVSEVDRKKFEASIGGNIMRYPRINHPEIVREQILSGLEDYGVVVSRVSLSLSRVYVYYYADEELPFGFADYPTLETEVMCEASKSDTESLFSDRITTITSFWGSMRGYPRESRTLFTFGLQDLGQPPAFGKLTTSFIEVAPELFDSKASCDLDRQRIIDFYNDILVRPVTDAVCSQKNREDGRYEMLMFNRISD